VVEWNWKPLLRLIPTPQPPPVRQHATRPRALSVVAVSRRPLGSVRGVSRGARARCPPPVYLAPRVRAPSRWRRAPRAPGATGNGLGGLLRGLGLGELSAATASLILCFHVSLVIPYPGCASELGWVMRIDECGLVLEQDAMGYATTGKHLMPQNPDPAHGSTSPCNDPTPARKADAWQGEWRAGTRSAALTIKLPVAGVQVDKLVQRHSAADL